MEQDPEYFAEKLVPQSPEFHAEIEEIRYPPDEVTTEDEVKTSPQTALSATREKVLSADDTMTTGAVPLSTYVLYLKSVRKSVLMIGMVLSYFFANGAQFFQQFTIAKWTELSKGDAMAAALGVKYLRSLVYAAGVVSLFLWLRSFLTVKVGVR